MSEKSKLFKRFFTAMLAVCLSIMLSCGFVLLRASADDYLWGEGRNPLWNEVECRSWFDSQNISYTNDYICLNVKYNSFDNGYDYTYYVTYYFGFSDNSEFTYDENNYIVLSNSLFDSKYSRSGKTYIDNQGELRSGLTPAAFVNSSALSSIRDSVTLKFKEDMSDIYINDVHYSSEIVYYRYHIGDIDSQYSDIRVSFAPSLNGTIDRSIDLGNGSTAMEQTLLMTVDNRSDYGIQYSMSIYKKNQSTRRNSTDINTSDSVFFDSDPVFTYYTSDWVYCTPYDNKNDIFNDDVTQKQNKSTSWHRVSAASTQQQVIKFSQMNLKQGEEYTVKVNAIRCDYDCASEKFTSLAENDAIYSELYMLDRDSIETVYSSDFSFLQYDDVVYNPDDTSGGIVPYDGYTNGISQQKQYAMSRNAMENQDGSIDYTHKDVYSDSNSWYNNQRNDNLPYDLPNYNPSGDGEYNDVLTKTIPVFGFFRTVFGYFPSDVFTIFNLSLWATFIILVLRRLH